MSMFQIRYALIDYPQELDGKMFVREDNKFGNVPEPHHMMSRYHYTRMGPTTLFAKCWYAQRHHDKLVQMSGVTMLPPTFSRKTVHSAIETQGNQHHHKVLTDHGVPYDAHTITSDLVDWFAEHHNRIFDHEF